MQFEILRTPDRHARKITTLFFFVRVESKFNHLRAHQHQLHEHIQHIRSQIHARRVREILVDVSEGPGAPQKRIDRLIQSPRGSSILLRGDLSVQSARVEEYRGLLEGNGTLTRGHTGERVVPLEVDAEAAVRREEAPLDEV